MKFPEQGLALKKCPFLHSCLFRDEVLLRMEPTKLCFLGNQHSIPGWECFVCLVGLGGKWVIQWWGCCRGPLDF